MIVLYFTGIQFLYNEPSVQHHAVLVGIIIPYRIMHHSQIKNQKNVH
jgi:hypothetical protein